MKGLWVLLLLTVVIAYDEDDYKKPKCMRMCMTYESAISNYWHVFNAECTRYDALYHQPQRRPKQLALYLNQPSRYRNQYIMYNIHNMCKRVYY